VITEKEITSSQQGDREAFIKVIQSIEQALYNTARSIVKKEEDVADALQETILKAYKSISTLREPAYFKTWIFRILINECNTLLSKRNRNVAVADFPDVGASSQSYEQVELREAVDQLEPQQRIVIVLHYFQDLPLKQIADMLDLSEGAVKTRLYRARNSLLQELQPIKKGSVNYEPL
jgi:RNA polymerase sigma-70 factor (ECF subfamily)